MMIKQAVVLWIFFSTGKLLSIQSRPGSTVDVNFINFLITSVLQPDAKLSDQHLALPLASFLFLLMQMWRDHLWRYALMNNVLIQGFSPREHNMLSWRLPARQAYSDLSVILGRDQTF